MIRALGAAFVQQDNSEWAPGRLLDEGWSSERPSYDKLGIFSLIPHPLEREEGLELEIIIDRAYMRKSLQNPTVQGSESFRVVKHIDMGRVTHSNFIRTEAPVLKTLPDLALHLALHLYLLSYP